MESSIKLDVEYRKSRIIRWTGLLLRELEEYRFTEAKRTIGFINEHLNSIIENQ